MSVLTIINAAGSTSTIYVSNVQFESGSGYTSYDLHVEGAPFVGYVCGVATNGSVNDREKQAVINHGAGSMALKISSGDALGEEDRKSQAINLPVGVYVGCDIQINANTIDISQDVNIDAAVSYSLTPVYEDGIMNTNVSCFLMREGIENPE